MSSISFDFDASDLIQSMETQQNNILHLQKGF